jgi:transposase
LLTSPASTRVWVATSPVDLRKGFDGLAGLVEQSGLSLYDGDLFVFLSRRRDRAKVLWWDRGGLALFYKRLEQGQFVPPVAAEGERHLVLDRAQLAMLLDGVDLRQVRRLKAWEPRRPGRNEGIDTKIGS